MLVSTPPPISTPETPTSTPTSTATPEHRTPTPTSTPTPMPTVINNDADAFVLPVLLLPETGMPPHDNNRGDVVLLLCFVGAYAVILWRGLARKK